MMLPKNLHCTPKIPQTITHIPNLSSKPHSSPTLPIPKNSTEKEAKLGLENGSVKCSMDYNNVNNGQYYEYGKHVVGQPQYPRPSEIEWGKEICNSVQLIGIVGTAVQTKHLTSGKVLAWSRLAVKKSPTGLI